MTHHLAGARGTVTDREAVLRDAQAWATAKGAEAFLADASVVFGLDHLESAALHAERARATGTMATRSLPMEAMLYLSGCRQVADAIEAAGLRDGTQAIALVVFGDASVENLIAHLGWTHDDSVLAAGGKSLRVLGLTKEGQGTVPRERAEDLALERTALVDLEK